MFSLGIKKHAKNHRGLAACYFTLHGDVTSPFRLFFNFIAHQELMVAGFIAVHSGAGFFSSENRKCILTACKQAALVGVEWLKRGETAVEASCAATAILEDHPATNAGLGANLTSAESVELDATVMDGETLDFGSVGAIPNVKAKLLVNRVFQ